MATAADVLNGGARWSCEAADCLEFVRGLPDDSIDLLFTSPPYLEARTYGINAGRKIDSWVAWMLELFAAAAPKVRGLMAVNCEGQTRDYQYLPAPFLLIADLHRAGFNLRKPPAFHLVGIPGSGGPDWLRNDYEPVVCVTRAGRLPWSDPTACGKPPTWKPGGAMSYRKPDGTRKEKGEARSKAVAAGVGKKMRTIDSGEWADSETAREWNYVPPDIANPGNVIKCTVGGGRLGHPLATENEAPFPLELPAFFVKSFAPPDGVVLDCFSGSGTTCHAAVENGRRFIGADIRQSQVELCERRMRTVTPSLLPV